MYFVTDSKTYMYFVTDDKTYLYFITSWPPSSSPSPSRCTPQAIKSCWRLSLILFFYFLDATANECNADYFLSFIMKRNVWAQTWEQTYRLKRTKRKSLMTVVYPKQVGVISFKPPGGIPEGRPGDFWCLNPPCLESHGCQIALHAAPDDRTSVHLQSLPSRVTQL